ncbi:alpha/beta fold hydrolase [Maricaulis sp. MIT060901]|uniref:alpha/beta fold hydrolase n=1 Tax=Maricaulis sp. MIT060901 TaxID=3096993 RepID=UPI00399B6E42
MMKWILGLVVILLVVVGWMFFKPEPAADLRPASERPVPTSPYWSEDDHWVDADGMTFRVREQGPQGAPVIVLIHGFSYSLESFDAWAEDLAVDYRVVRFDLPGHALTGPDPQQRYSVRETVALTASLLDSLGHDDVVLVGNSLGGLVSWRLAAEQPELVSRLILLAPGGFSINGVTENPVPVPAPVAFFMTSAPQAMVGAASAGLFGDPTNMPAELPGRVHDLMRQPGVGQALVERLEVFTLPAPETDLARVEADTLILWGELDRIVPPDHGPRFVDAMPSARLEVMPGLGHVVHEEAPEVSLERVRAFLEDQP